jgi:hypothetical protein
VCANKEVGASSGNSFIIALLGSRFTTIRGINRRHLRALALDARYWRIGQIVI